MKRVIIFGLIFSFFACSDPGRVHEVFNYETSVTKLPPELSGLKIYNVSLGNGNYVKVAVLNNNMCLQESSYDVATKMTEYEYTIIVNNSNQTGSKIIEASEILSETDSIIVLKK